VVEESVVMKLWQSLYLMIWLAFFEIILVMSPYMDLTFKRIIHVLLGAGMVALAYWNVQMLRDSPAPDRVKRISRATLGLAVAAGVTGLLFFPIYWYNLDIISWLFEFVHVGIALTIIAQASSTATGYDMWEEGELGGPVPEKPAEVKEPGAAAATRQT
jgi:hypothetical protein